MTEKCARSRSDSEAGRLEVLNGATGFAFVNDGIFPWTSAKTITGLGVVRKLRISSRFTLCGVGALNLMNSSKPPPLKARRKWVRDSMSLARSKSERSFSAAVRIRQREFVVELNESIGK